MGLLRATANSHAKRAKDLAVGNSATEGRTSIPVDSGNSQPARHLPRWYVLRLQELDANTAGTAVRPRGPEAAPFCVERVRRMAITACIPGRDQETAVAARRSWVCRRPGCTDCAG